MPANAWPLRPALQRNADGNEAKGVLVAAVNCYRDSFGNLKKRPAVNGFSILGSFNDYRVEGVYWWDEQSRLIAVAGGRIFDVSSTGVATDVTGAGLQQTGTVTFASDGNTLHMVNGKRIVKYTPGSNTVYAAGNGAPDEASSVVYFDGYLLASIPGTARIDFGEYNQDTGEYDFAGNFFTAESRPDNLLGLRQGNREVVAVGLDSIEFFWNDGQTPFSRVGNMILDVGCGAFNSFIHVEDTWYFLDDQRNIVRLRGRQRELISYPIARDLWEMSSVSDCYANVFKWEGQFLISFNFPGAGRCFVFDQRFDEWYEWSQWDLQTSQESAYVGLDHVYARAWNKVIIGSRSQTVLGTLEPDSYEDMSTRYPVRMRLRTSLLDWGTTNIKNSRKLYMRVLRGTADGDMTFTMRFRSDGNYAWTKHYEFSQGVSGDANQYLYLNSLGQYRSRQWEFLHSGAGPMTVMEVQEDVEVLDA